MTTMRAIQVQRFGGPEVLELRDVPAPVAADGLVKVDVLAAGINYADTHQAENSYHAPATLPLIPGAEVVGLTPDGQRVVALLPGGGGYAEQALVAPALTMPLPDGVSDGAALSLILQGLTAWHLLRTTARLSPGETVVVHAAAGGVGTIAVQLAKRWGAGRVIAAASSETKRELALSLGADAAVDANSDDLRAALLDANDGRKVDVVLEMVGGSTFEQSLRALAPFGRVVSYGMASRQIPAPVDVAALNRYSTGVLGFWLVHALGDRALFEKAMTELLTMVQDGSLRTIVGGTYPLADARRAHEDLRSRATVGKLVLDPRA
jgi:NADPH2:quinone reductase